MAESQSSNNEHGQDSGGSDVFLSFVKWKKLGKNWFQLRMDVRLENNSLETHTFAPFIYFLQRVYRLGREAHPTHKT